MDVVARRPRGGAPRIEIGSSVWCHWDSDDVHVFPDDETHPSPQPDRLAITEPA